MGDLIWTLGRPLARFYLAIYDLAMKAGPMRGALLIGYGPIVLAALAFIAKGQMLDPVLGSSGATLTIFVLFAFCGPLMNTGSKIVTELWHFRRTGAWPGQGPLERPASQAPSITRVEALRQWVVGD